MQSNRLVRGLVTVLASLSLVLSTGCSAFQPKMQNVLISTPEVGAEIHVNGQKIGTSPVAIPLERNKEHAIIAKHKGKTGTFTLGNKMSTTGVLDIIGTFFFIVPVIGIFTPGFKELDSTNVVLPLQ